MDFTILNRFSWIVCALNLFIPLNSVTVILLTIYLLPFKFKLFFSLLSIHFILFTKTNKDTHELSYIYHMEPMIIIVYSVYILQHCYKTNTMIFHKIQ